MSKASELRDRENARKEAANASLDGIQVDITALHLKITELNASPGELTPEDQAALDEIEAGSQALVDRLAGVDAQN